MSDTPAGGGALPLWESDGVCVLWRTSGFRNNAGTRAPWHTHPSVPSVHARSLASPGWASDSAAGEAGAAQPGQGLCAQGGAGGAWRADPGPLVLGGQGLTPHPLSAEAGLSAGVWKDPPGQGHTPSSGGAPESCLCPPSRSRLSPPCPLLIHFGENGRGRGGEPITLLPLSRTVVLCFKLFA